MILQYIVTFITVLFILKYIIDNKKMLENIEDVKFHDNIENILILKNKELKLENNKLNQHNRFLKDEISKYQNLQDNIKISYQLLKDNYVREQDHINKYKIENIIEQEKYKAVEYFINNLKNNIYNDKNISKKIFNNMTTLYNNKNNNIIIN